MKSLSDELSQYLAGGAAELRGKGDDAGFDHADASMSGDWNVSSELTAIVRKVLEARRARASFFPEGLFGEPAWDMLLDLFIAQQESKQISISSACIASGGSATTALRWLSRLEKMELVERSSDESDRRRIFVRITPRAHSAIIGWLDRFNRPGKP